ncbi:Protein kinase-like domain protein [Niveomyces insectorum RCEF 264]|uniref:Protein kinase-like domain protein n=1 Tax=Niveomyces insectorum RCEF 264 TaxID=1081102 RepID=A0A167WUR0_9HYPO|nr:Protein kinase-like domain protein [Niveomyces insectorum RCEF 264]
MIMDMRNEIDIYNHLPKGHPRFLEMLSSYDVNDTYVGIELEYMPTGTLRTYLEENHIEMVGGDGGSTPVISARLRACWAVEIADGIGFLHKHGVIHCDIKPHNMLLDNTLGVRVIDLAGSRLGDRRSLCCESDRFYMPRDARDLYGTVKTDLFAVGMSLFAVVTGAQPYGEIEDRSEIIARYKRQEFPSLAVVVATGPSKEAMVKYVTKYKSTNPDEVGRRGAPANTSAAARALAPANASGREVLFAGAMRRCWHGQFSSAADLLVALAEEIRATFSDSDVAYIEEACGLSLRGATVGHRLDGVAVDGTELEKKWRSENFILRV